MLSKKVQKDQAKSLQVDEIKFKLRVADLLDTWIKRNGESFFCVFVFLALFIDLVTDKVQPLSRMLHARADGVVVAVVPGT